MGDLNIFERDSNLSMEADFYLLEILSKKAIEPNDLPALLEIPVKEFLRLEFTKKERKFLKFKILYKYRKSSRRKLFYKYNVDKIKIFNKEILSIGE